MSWNHYESLCAPLLIENANDSLRVGIGHFISGKKEDLKYVVLLTAHSVELYLKARLARVHDCLIMDDPGAFSPMVLKTGKFKTVNVDCLHRRLGAVGVNIGKNEKASLDEIVACRNRVQHFDKQISISETHTHLSNVIILLQRFLPKELKMEFKPPLTKAQNRTLEGIVSKYNIEYATAKKHAAEAKEAGLALFRCFHCYKWLVAGKAYGDKVTCYFCKTPGALDSCDYCGGLELLSKLRSKSDDSPVICDACLGPHFGTP